MSSKPRGPAGIYRYQRGGTATIGAGASISSAMAVGDFAGGAVRLNTTFDGDSVWFHGRRPGEDTFYRIYADDGTTIAVTVTRVVAAGGWLNLRPEVVYPFEEIKLAGTANQGTAEDLPFAFKG